jgi:arylsulfatase A-like enzyme
MTKSTIPGDMQGKSFAPLLTGQDIPWRRAAYYHYYEFPEPHHVYPHFGVRTDRYTLVHFYGDLDTWELYDLQKDPRQVSNLFGKPGYEKVTTELKAQLKALMVDYKDDEALRLLAKSK